MDGWSVLGTALTVACFLPDTTPTLVAALCDCWLLVKPPSAIDATSPFEYTGVTAVVSAADDPVPDDDVGTGEEGVLGCSVCCCRLTEDDRSFES